MPAQKVKSALTEPMFLLAAGELPEGAKGVCCPHVTTLKRVVTATQAVRLTGATWLVSTSVREAHSQELEVYQHQMWTLGLERG